MSSASGDRPAMTEAQQVAARAAMRDLFPTTPAMSMLGMVVERFEPDLVRMRLPFREDLTNDGRAYHGGLIATLMDSAGGLAAWSNHDFTKGTRAATVSIAIQYVGAAAAGSDLRCEGRALRRGRELIFCDMRVTDVEDRLLAHGQLTYRIV